MVRISEKSYRPRISLPWILYGNFIGISYGNSIALTVRLLDPSLISQLKESLSRSLSSRLIDSEIAPTELSTINQPLQIEQRESYM